MSVSAKASKLFDRAWSGSMLQRKFRKVQYGDENISEREVLERQVLYTNGLIVSLKTRNDEVEHPDFDMSEFSDKELRDIVNSKDFKNLKLFHNAPEMAGTMSALAALNAFHNGNVAYGLMVTVVGVAAVPYLKHVAHRGLTSSRLDLIEDIEDRNSSLLPEV